MEDPDVISIKGAFYLTTFKCYLQVIKLFQKLELTGKSMPKIETNEQTKKVYTKG